MKAIILIHGLFLHPIFMGKMKRYFEKRNYKVYSFGYQSRSYNQSVLDSLCELVNTIKQETNEIYFIGHSMGGIVARSLLQEYNLYLDDSAIITLGTPHHTSHLGTYLKNSVIGAIMGSAGDSGIISRLEDWNECIPLGCIAGVVPLGINTILSAFHHKTGPSDGTVFVEEALLDNASDNMIVKCQHTAMIYNQEVMALCDTFIKNKKFT